MPALFTPMREISASARLSTWWNARITLVVLWLGVCLALGGNLLVAHPWRDDGVSGGDFQSFYNAGLAVWNNQDPYSFSLEVYRKMLENNSRPETVFQYPPPFAVAITPLTILPYHIALLVWTGLELASFVLMIGLLVRAHLSRSWLQWTALLVIICSLTAMFRNEIKNGQINIILTCFVAGSYFAHTRKRPMLAGVLLALATIVKPYFGLLFLFFLWKRSYRPIISAALTGVVCFVGSLFVLGLQPHLEWFTLARSISQVPYAAARHLVSVQAFTLRFIASFHPYAPWSQQPTWIATAAGIALDIGSGILVLRVVRRAALSEERVALEFALFVSWMLLIFPVLEDVQVISICSSLTLLTIVAWKRYQKGQVGTRTLLLVGVCFLYFINPLLPRWQWAGYIEPITGVLVWETGAYLPGLFLVFGMLCYLLWKSGESQIVSARLQQARSSLIPSVPSARETVPNLMIGLDAEHYQSRSGS